MYWIPLIPINNYNWTGLALPLPLQKDWFNFNYINNICKIKDKNYILSNKVIRTAIPPINIKTNLNNFDTTFTNNFFSLKWLKITLSGRLKGISKAKKSE